MRIQVFMAGKKVFISRDMEEKAIYILISIFH